MTAGKINLSTREPSYDIGTVIDPRFASDAARRVREAAVEGARALIVNRCSDEDELAEVLAMLGIEAS